MASLSLGLLSMGGATGAHATSAESTTSSVAEDAFTEEEVAELHEFFDAHGVDASTAVRLISDLDNGIMWDSMSEAADPVSTQQHIEDNQNVTIETCDDGSIVVSSVSLPDDDSGTKRGRRSHGCLRVFGRQYTDRLRGRYKLGLYPYGIQLHLVHGARSNKSSNSTSWIHVPDVHRLFIDEPSLQ